MSEGSSNEEVGSEEEDQVQPTSFPPVLVADPSIRCVCGGQYDDKVPKNKF